MTKPTKWHVHPAKTRISLGIRPVWSESSLCAQWVAKDPIFLHADSVDSDQTGRMPRLIWVFAGRTCHFVGFVTRWLICLSHDEKCQKIPFYGLLQLYLLFENESLHFFKYLQGKQSVYQLIRNNMMLIFYFHFLLCSYAWEHSLFFFFFYHSSLLFYSIRVS